MTMRNRLIDHVHSLFRSAADTPANRELEEEILRNTLDRYDDLIADGRSEEEAYGQAAAGIGDLRQLLEKPKKKSHVGWIVAGAAALLLIVPILVMLLSYSSHRIHPREEFFVRAEGETASTQNFPPDGLTGLQIDWISGTVRVEVGTSSQVTVTGNGEDMLLNERNGVLFIEHRDKVFDFMEEPCHLTVQVPASLSDSLSFVRVDTTSGDIAVEGLHLRSLSLESVSGNVSAHGRCGEFHAATTSGDVLFSGEADDVEVESVSGQVEILADRTPDELSAENTSGEIVISLPDDRGFHAEFDTVSGRYDCEHASVRGDEVSYMGSAEQRPAELELESVSGDMWIKRR
jgi:hypothetical protein